MGNKICGIYKITSPKGRIYIGQSVNIFYRFYSYKKLNCKEQYRLYNSLKKHGVENHKFEIIEECSKENLDEREIYYIKLFDCFDTEHGLNLRNGGRKKGIMVSEETKLRSSNSLKKAYEEGRRERPIGKKNGRYGKGMSNETKKKVINANLKYWAKIRKKGIKEMIRKTTSRKNNHKKIIKMWKNGYSCKEICKIMNVKVGSVYYAINNSLQSKLK